MGWQGLFCSDYVVRPPVVFAVVLLPLGCKRLARFSSHFFCHLHCLIRHWFKAIFNVLALLLVHILDLATLLNVDKDATL